MITEYIVLSLTPIKGGEALHTSSHGPFTLESCARECARQFADAKIIMVVRPRVVSQPGDAVLSIMPRHQGADEKPAVFFQGL